jgi:hypothetical protein
MRTSMSEGVSRKKWNRDGSVLTVALLVLAFIGLLVIAGFITNQKGPRSFDICTKNLRLIDDAKDRWSLENRGKPLSRITERDLIGHAAKKSCPSGGSYFLNLVGLPAQCSIEGHTPVLTESCRWNVNFLNHAATHWQNTHPTAKGIDFFPREILGYRNALKAMPTCRDKGKYIFNSDTFNFQCSLGTHD